MIKHKISSNITEIIKWVQEIPSKIANDKIAESCARIFAERARAKLKSSGALQQDIDRYVNAITFYKVADGKWRISAGKGTDEQLKDDMYYLEFGTGIIASGTKTHPEAPKIGWKYNVNNHSGAGWTFIRSKENGNENAFIAKNDIIHKYKRTQHAGSTTGFGRRRRIRIADIPVGSEKNVQSKGVIAVRYFYDTITEFDDILQQALKENGV